MKFDTTLLVSDLSAMPALTQAAETLGFDGIWVSETAHDAFLPLTLAAEHSQRLSLGTSIALAFPRSPATLVYLAWARRSTFLFKNATYLTADTLLAMAQKRNIFRVCPFKS